ncbi:MAG: 16S rRNA (adenine(1518)-N(6)/adenine(1519)-N(6))-dimethyltransferase RsmA [Syntrophomonadaceae bacterium]|nr:16S rRNA (adenine(1518)-N(6)/adenine(1519)-N(6))-dimethyltransferase RsmA [Syntrophomonadaceae bacterium]
MEIASPGLTKRILKKHGFQQKKSLGQHFLVDQSIVRQIVAGAELESRDVVVEIGPGIGTLTRALADQAGQVISVELDRSLLPLLDDTLKGYQNIQIVQGDALKMDFDQLVGKTISCHSLPAGYKVVANLPYYITTPLVMHLLASGFQIKSLVLMMQQEVAMRILAKPGSKEYGALTVAVLFFALPRLITLVSPAAFSPPPEVSSAVVLFEVRSRPPVDIPDRDLFFRIVKSAFGQRRKTLLNALSAGGLGPSKEQWDTLLIKSNLDGLRRGETLSLEEYAALCRELWKWKQEARP